MRIKLSKDTEQFQIMIDYWNLQQEIWGIEDTTEYRTHACQEINKFLKKHNTPYAEGLSRVLLDELNRRKSAYET